MCSHDPHGSRSRSPLWSHVATQGDGLGTHRKYVSLSQSQLSRLSPTPDGGLPRRERAMSGSNSRCSKAAAVSALRAMIAISELR